MEQQQRNPIQLMSFTPPALVLVIDDLMLNRKMIKSLFTAPNYEVIEATNGSDGFKLAKEKHPEIILLDIMMPMNDGYEVCEWLKQASETAQIPIIFITALDSIQEKVKGFEHGAVDYVTKPFNYREVVARVNTHLSLRRASLDREKMLTMAIEQKRDSMVAKIAAGLSHNFSNLIGVSIGNISFAEALLPEESAEDIKAAIKDVHRSLVKQQKLLHQFLRLADRGAIDASKPKQEMVPLRQEIDDTVANLQSQGNKFTCSMKIVNEIPEDYRIFCDSGHISEILFQLLREISESSQGKASISFTLQPTVGAIPNLGFKMNIDGIFYPAEIGDSIFEPFSLPLANVGTGLAFSVAKKLVSKNNGELKVNFPSAYKLTLSFEFNS